MRFSKTAENSMVCKLIRIEVRVITWLESGMDPENVWINVALETTKNGTFADEIGVT